jgi:hypothetical protein
MTDDAETVADVLRAVDGGGDCEPLLGVAAHPDDPHDLSYEDWVQPMKLTGGRVCLRISYPDNGIDEILYRAKSGVMKVQSVHGGPVDDAVPTWSKDVLLADETDITPVLRENTPFAEDDDGD